MMRTFPQKAAEGLREEGCLIHERSKEIRGSDKKVDSVYPHPSLSARMIKPTPARKTELMSVNGSPNND
jgi:hypothetical protein